MERRRLNVSNFGATWLKPPGVVKSLFQMREERREQEEHAEAMRREQLAQELAEAEAEAAAAAAEAAEALEDGAELVGVEDMDEDMDGGGRDLDDDIPDADEGGFGYDGASDDDDEDDDNEDDEEEDDDDADEVVNRSGGVGSVQRRRDPQQDLANYMAMTRAAEDHAREQIARGGQEPGSNIYGEDDDGDEEDPAQMLEEDDLVHMSHQIEVEPGMDMDMDANLDDDVPEAESIGYEHTDTEAELTSSDDDDDGGGGNNTSFAAARAPLNSRFRSSLARSDGTRNSLDINSILSRDNSSALGSSPNLRRRN